MPQTRSARGAHTILLFKSFGDDVLNHILATVSFADRSAITCVCKQWRHVVASKPFERARRAIGEVQRALQVADRSLHSVQARAATPTAHQMASDCSRARARSAHFSQGGGAGDERAVCGARDR